MGNLFRSGMEALARTVAAAAGIDVEYRRGDRATVLRVVPKEITVRTDAMPGDGGFLETTFRRYIVERSMLLFDAEEPDSVFLPGVGDQVAEPDGRLYRVCLFQGETAWSDHDLSGVKIQFHATEISHAETPETGGDRPGAAPGDGGPASGGLLLP